MPQTHLILHVPKTGGRALGARLLGRTDLSVCHDTGLACHVRLTEFHREHTGSGRPVVLMAHGIMGVHFPLGLVPRYHAILREPVERDVSNYHFLRDEPRHGDSKWARELDLVTFLATRQPTDIQVRHVLAQNGAMPEGPLHQGHLDLAKWLVETHFGAVGFHDNYPEAVARITSEFGPPLKVEQLSTTGGRERGALAGADERQIRARNELDTELYRWARERFPV